MITKRDNYAAWALLVQELEDAKEHLETLMREISEDPDYDEPNLRVDLGHIYSHLNRVWNGRNETGQWTQEQHETFSRFPKDLEAT